MDKVQNQNLLPKSQERDDGTDLDLRTAELSKETGQDVNVQRLKEKKVQTCSVCPPVPIREHGSENAASGSHEEGPAEEKIQQS